MENYEREYLIRLAMFAGLLVVMMMISIVRGV